MGKQLALDDLAEVVSETLETLSKADIARKLRKQVQTIRGIRGVSLGDVAKVAASTWQDAHPALPEAGPELTRLFGTAFEDGLVAIGLLAAALPDAPAEAFAIGLDWVERVDDVATADALGWLVLGPAALLMGKPLEALGPVLGHGRPAVRRAGVMCAMAWLPEPIEGPAAAPLRAKLGQRHTQWVDVPQSVILSNLADRILRDESPEVRKALRRVLRTWTASDPTAVAEWGERWVTRGGLPKLLSDETKRARRKADAR